MTDTIDGLVLECLPRTRFIGESVFWAKYERLCNKSRVVPLPGQVKTALRRLVQEKKIIVNAQGARKV
jgi:hypothetical protein